MGYSPDREYQLDNVATQELQDTISQVTIEAVDEVRALTLANIYLKRNQNTKAIEILDKSGIQTATVFLALGDIYRFDGTKNQQAKENYQKAIEKAIDAGDGQVIVVAKAGLAKIAAANGEMKVVARLHEEARATFQDLKDAEKWDEVEQKLSSSDNEERTLVFLSSCPNCDFFGGNGRISGGNRCRGC